MSNSNEKVITFPPKFYPVVEAMQDFSPNRKRNICLYGGRAAGKTVSVCKLLLFLGTLRPLRILACREVMSSIDQSIHRELIQAIGDMGLEAFYDVEKYSIYGRNDPDREKCTVFKYIGLKANIDSVRSYSGFDVCFLEECHDLTQNSFRVLDPTIRKKHSQMIFNFNPRFDTDFVYRKFVTDGGGDDSLVIKMDYVDNPFISETSLLPQIERMRETDYQEYLHVYLGSTLSTGAGSILTQEIHKAEAEKRFTSVPYDPHTGVQAFWDMGWSDSMICILAQHIPGGEIHILDCIEGSQQPMSWYLEEIRQREHVNQYRVKKHNIPHDGAAHQYTSGLSAEEVVRNAGYPVQIIPQQKSHDSINAVRAMFSNMWFDARNCGELISNLKLYRYKVSETTIDGDVRLSREPLHDHSSHFFDALSLVALSLRPPKIEPIRGTAGIPTPNPFGVRRGNGWMGTL